MNRKNVNKETLQSYISVLSQMINCRTVFKYDGSTQNEFDKLYHIIDKNFPLIKQKMKRYTFGSGCFFYEICGNEPHYTLCLMSHHDVVDASEDDFHATIKDGALYGRGSIDTKTPLFSELQAMEQLLQEDYDFNHLRVFIGSSNNEEVCGDGMVEAVAYFKKENIHFDLVMDEGGAITTNMIPGYKGKSAMVAVHEKSRHMYQCTTKNNNKGHGGLSPDDDQPLLRLTSFINEVNNTKIYKNQFYPEVKATFKNHASVCQFPMNLIFKHLDLFSPIVKQIMTKIPPAKAMLNTSITFTSLFAGLKTDPQIRAKDACATMFIRCIREDDLNKGLRKIKEIAQKYDVDIHLVERDYCKPSSFETKEFALVKKILNQNFPDVLVSPYLLTAGTDARRFSEIATNILRFAPIDLDEKQFKSIHGDKEHIYIENIGQCVMFYYDLIKEIGGK